MSSAPPREIPDLRVFAQYLEQATSPADVFGEEADAKSNYRRLAHAVHPDRHGGDPEAAQAFRRLNEWWQLAERQLASGSYGKAKMVTVRSKRASYAVAEKIASGDASDVFRCFYEKAGATVPGVFKTIRSPRDADLIQHEAAVLKSLHRKVKEEAKPFLPELVETLRYKQPGGVIRQANVFADLDGFRSLDEVIAAYPRGIDPRDMAWMWRRLLYILGTAHNEGYVHGAPLPGNVLIHPELHGLVLIDWAHAVRSGEQISVISKAHRDWYPPEVIDREKSGPETDVWLGACTMLAIQGLEPPTFVSGGMPKPMRAFFRACFLPFQKRPDDAFWLLGAFNDVLERCYGPRKFRPFSMNGHNRKER